jgi:hypothetical protein
MSALRLLVHGVMRAADARGLAARVAPFGDLAAVVSEDNEPEGDDAARTLALAQRHHALLSEIAATCDVLPVRLGAAFADEAAAARQLAEMADVFRAGLAACAGAVEYSLVVEDLGAPVAPEPPDSGGKTYLKARSEALARSRARPARIAETLDGLEAQLRPHVRALARRPAAPPRALDLTALVQRHATPTVLSWINQRQDELAALGLAADLRGPWPVYSFATLFPGSLS